MSTDPESCAFDCNDESGDSTVAADPELLAQGWVRRNLEEPGRTGELAELYQSLGYEVRVEPLKPEDFPDQCQTCGLSICSSYVMIYTRKA